MIILIPLITAIIGLVTFVLAKGDAKELGRILFFCGVLVTLFTVMGHAVRLLPT